MARKKHEEGHDNAERWLLTYADLITLLLALFIILYAMNQVDQKKFEEVAQALSMGFNQPASVSIIDLGTHANAHRPATESEIKTMKAIREDDQLRKIKNQIDEKIESDPKLTGKASTNLSDDGLMITIADDILFQSGTANLTGEARSLINLVTPLVLDIQNSVKISGHTDSVPIKTAAFPSNWELSSARAHSVLHLMLQNKALSPTRMSSSGYGEYQPIADNKTAKGRSENRRVEIMIERINKENLLKPNASNS